MGINKRLPHEGKVTSDDRTNNLDGLPTAEDVEGHFLPGMPGTGGDNLHKPSGGGEVVDDDDVEGHFLPGMPGTGGDSLHRPAGGGE